MKTLTYFPIVSNEYQLIDLISRAAWFFASFPIDRINIFISSDKLRSVKWRVAEGMDEAIERNFGKLRSLINFVLVHNISEIQTYMEEADIILIWQKDSLPEFVSESIFANWLRGKKVWRVDPNKVRMEGSFYIEACLYLTPNKQSLIDKSRSKFERLAKKLGKFERACLLATGPSISNYRKFNFKGSFNIVCNSVILNEDLMRLVRPQILVFADPIFHFGPSQYAGEFRRAVINSVQKYDFFICIPFKYYSLFVSSFPELEERTIGIPFDKDLGWNFSLDVDFYVKTTANVLTLLMIPLACTFAKKIGILGCDGRPLSESNYFWKHNESTQINDKMTNIRNIHPGFFNIDYNDYYLDHCRILDEQIRAAENLGFEFYSLTFSHIPALSSRIKRCWRENEMEVKKPHCIVLIDPDAKNWSGHYMAYNEKISRELIRRNISFKVICRRDLDPKILAERPNYIPIFTSHSWEVGNRKNNAQFAKMFEAEIERALAQILKENDGPILLYMYCGSIDHAYILRKFYLKYKRLHVNINLFWASFTINKDWAEHWQEFIAWLDIEADKGRFIATLPTREICNELAEYTGCILPVAPHPSTGLSDEEFIRVNNQALNKNSRNFFNILFPSAPRVEKGYEYSIECAKLLAQNKNMRSIIRHAPTSTTPKKLDKLLENLPHTIEIVEGALSDKQFRDLFKRVDVVVLPYMPDAFSKRTSGLLIDAIYHGIPCVVIDGTWLSNIVNKYHCGIAVKDVSAHVLADAVIEITQNYEIFRLNAIKAGRDYFSKNSWGCFVDILLGNKREESPEILANNVLVGPFERNMSAYWDETYCIAHMFEGKLSGSVMIDVGAHHGSALMPFLNKGWQIFAFEPDNKNRDQLLKRIAKHENKYLISLDSRYVSNKSQKAVPFYSSSQSTGISGLSSFHESHVEAQRVDTITLTEYFRDRPMPSVDFLKIDTEGHDLFVLQGYPWERSKPAVIECEFEDSKTVPLGYTFHDLAQFLVEKGYTVYVSEWHPIIRYGIRHDWHRLTRYPCELANPKGWGNLLAFRDPIDEKDLVTAVRKVLKFGSSNTATKSATSVKAGVGTKPKMHRGFLIEQSPYYSKIAPNQWNYTHSNDPQRLWIAAIDTSHTKGRHYIGGFRLKSDRAMTLNVTLGRYGRTDWEGTAKQIKLSPNIMQSMKLGKTFNKDHAALKLQLDVVELEGSNSATLTIEPLGIWESFESIIRRIGKENCNLRMANRLFREGELLTAMTIYCWLYRQRPLKMYLDNALFVTRRLGIDWVKSGDELESIFDWGVVA